MNQQKFDVPSSVGLTAFAAFAACAARAIEGSRPDRLVDDPFAVMFIQGARLDNHLPVAVDEVEHDSMLSSRFAGVRTRVFDDFLVHAEDDGIDQVVILAAGLDARAFRLHWSQGVDLYEVDHPDVLDFKEAVLADIGAVPLCGRHAVRADLAGNWRAALRAEGFDPDRRTAWMAEGLLPYLGAQEENDLLRVIRDLSAPGSRVCLEYMPPDVVARFRDHPKLDLTSDALGVPIRSMWNAEPRDETAELLGSMGWSVAFDSLDDSGRALGMSMIEEFGTPPSEGKGTGPAYDFTADMARCGYLTGELAPVFRS